MEPALQDAVIRLVRALHDDTGAYPWTEPDP